MEETEQVSELIGLIYDAALDRNLWERVLEDTCSYVEGMTSALMMQDSAQGTAQFYFQWGGNPDYIQSYNETYVKLSPVLVPTLLYAKVGGVLSTSDLLPYDEFLASRFYQEWAAPQGIVDALAATLDKSATSYAFIAVQRHERHGLVDAATKRRMGFLVPHFRRAVNIGKVIDLHKVEAAELADTLDGLATAMFLVDRNSRIVRANVAAHSLLSDSTVLRGAGGKLAAVDSKAQQALQEAFAATDSGDTAVGLKGIAIPLGESAGENWIAHILPLTSGARRRAGIEYSAVAAVFVRKAALDLPHPLETVANLYKLTPAELRVLMAIIQIGGVPEVAPVLGISETTVKTHLQRVFEKTGTNRQADLVKLIAGFVGPLR
jgi:DNA-binding CsgD family transcriptional regulator